MIFYSRRTYGSSRLKLRPLQPFVGLDATKATSMATTAKQTALQEGSCNQHLDIETIKIEIFIFREQELAGFNFEGPKILILCIIKDW
jgi:hypothetical protein